jgi:hypothetical protein
LKSGKWVINAAARARARADGCVGLMPPCCNYLTTWIHRIKSTFRLQPPWEWKVMWGCGPVDGNRTLNPPLLGLLSLHSHRNSYVYTLLLARELGHLDLISSWDFQAFIRSKKFMTNLSKYSPLHWLYDLVHSLSTFLVFSQIYDSCICFFAVSRKGYVFLRHAFVI